MMCLVLLHPLFFLTVNQEPNDVYGVKKSIIRFKYKENFFICGICVMVTVGRL